MDLGNIHQRVSSLANRMGQEIPNLDAVRRVKFDPVGHVDQAQDEFKSLLAMDNTVTNGYPDVDVRPNHIKHELGPKYVAEVEVSEDKTKIIYEETRRGDKDVVESFECNGPGLTRCTLVKNDGRLRAEIVYSPDGSTDNATCETWYMTGR